MFLKGFDTPKQKLFTYCCTLLLTFLPILGCAFNAASYSPPPPELNLTIPEGFSIEVFAKLDPCDSCYMTGPRMMTLDDKNNLYVTTGKLGKIYKILDSNNDGKADEILTWLDELPTPNGIDFFNGHIFIANEDSVLKIAVNDLSQKKIIVKGLATGGHSQKSIKVGPDEHLYVNIGSSCNVCIESDPTRATIQRYTLDGYPAGAIKTLGRHKPDPTWARGLRNSQGYAWHPITKKMYATNNGSDMRSDKKNGPINDSLPPEHFNEIIPNNHYGWPYCWGNQTPDPNFEGPTNFCSSTTSPLIMFTSHSTPIGISFLDQTDFPSDFKNDAIVALHGSWNRSDFSGYKLIRVRFDENNNPISSEDFVSGWLANGKAWGRPVDVIQSYDGGLFVSDDRSGFIYKITYTGK